MSETLQNGVTFYLKSRSGRVVSISTNGKHQCQTMRARLNTKDRHGYILRETKVEAEKDKTPTP